MNPFRTALLLATICIVPFGTKAQDTRNTPEDFRVVFEDVQRGFESGSVAEFSHRLALQVQVALKGEEKGYYSSNHAYYLLENFLKSRKVVSFEFTNVSDAESTPYATGTVVFTSKGTRETNQIYVALMKSGERWLIVELNIY
jgi:hypothetical protein